MTSTVDNKRVVTRDLYLRGETGANPGSDTVPRFSADGKMQFSTVTINSGGSLGVPGSAVIQGNLTVNGLINGGGGGGGGGGGVSVAAGPSGNVTVSTAASVATVDLAPLLTGVDISGDIDVTGEVEAKSLRVLTGAIVDGAFSAGSANVIGAAHVEGALTGGSTVTATGKIRSTGGDIEAINGILSGGLAVDGAATVGSLKANQTVTVAGKLAADAADISRNVAVGGNVDVSGVVTAAGLVLRNAFVIDTLEVRGAATISGDLYVNSTIHHVGLFDPPVGGTTVLQGGTGIDVTENPAVPGEWTITYTGGGGGGGGGISGIDEGSNIEVSGSGTNPTVSVRINETLDMCNNKITNVDIIELVSTATDTEDPRVSFKDVNGVQRAQVEYNQDNQAEPLLLIEGPRVLVEATEADNVSGVTLATAGNTLTVTNMSVDLAVPLLTMDGVEIAVDGSKNLVIDNTNTGGGYRFTSVPDVSGASGFDDMLVYNVATGEIRQMPAPMGTDICGGTNILVDKSTPEKPVVSLEVREDIDMGGKGLVFASGVGFSSGGSIIEGGAGSLRFTTKVGVNTVAGATPAQELEVNGGIQAQKLYLTGVANAVSAHAKVLGYNPTTKEFELQDAGGGGGGTVLTAGTNIDIVGDAVSVAIDSDLDISQNNIKNVNSIDISGTAIIGSGTTGNLRFTHQFGETFIESGAVRTTGSAAPLHFTDYNAQHTWVTIGDTGNVGIGTATPHNTLHVQGSAVLTPRQLAVAVGVRATVNDASIRYSYDGLTWNSAYGKSFSTSGFAVVAGDTIWIAVGEGSYTILWSRDALTWETSILPFSIRGSGVAWSRAKSLWVAVGKDTTTANNIKFSTDDGETWQSSLGGAFTVEGRCIGVHDYLNTTLWVAGGEGESTLKYSTDGKNWSNAVSTNIFTTRCLSVATNTDGTLWVAAGRGDGTLKWSTNGVNWNNSISGEFISDGTAVAYGGGLWVAGGSINTGIGDIVLKYSTDGKIWNDALSGANNAILVSGISYSSNVNGGPIWIAACSRNNPTTNAGIKYSYDGKNWVDVPSGALNFTGFGVTWGKLDVSDDHAKLMLQSAGRDCTLLSTGVGSNPAFYWRSNATNYKANFGGTSYFTGQHANVMVTPAITAETVSNYVGMIVSSADDGYCSVDDTGRLITGIDAIWTTEALPRIKLTDKDRDKAVWGVITNHRNGMKGVGGTNETDDTTEWETSLHGRIRVNGVGEGAIWVININGPLENGDYICSSEVPGYGRRQDDDLLHNYTVAKITMSCAFELGQNTYRCEEFEWRGQMLRRAYVGCTYHCS